MLQAELKYLHHQLVEDCRLGKRESQKRLYNMYAQAMYNSALRIVNNKMEAEDILQESFMEVFTKIKQFRGDASIGAWIKRIVINKSLNALRRQKVHFEALEEGREIAPDNDIANASDKYPYDIGQIREAISQLDHGYRTVFSLYLIEDFSHKEIAAQLGISVGTSKSQYNRAKAKIRQLLNERYGG